jgi:hypothetical protein
MPRSTSQFVIMAVVIGLAVVGASAIGIAAAQSSFEQAKRTIHSIKSPVSETDFKWVTISSSGSIFFRGERLR